jgi:hypothetical protein
MIMETCPTVHTVQIMQTIPDLAAIADPLLGKPYTDVDCWQLLRFVLAEGFRYTLDPQPANNLGDVCEIWHCDETCDPWARAQPWDLLVFATSRGITQHVGLVVNDAYLLHTRPRTGVCLEPLQRRWIRAQLFQVLRLRWLT